MSARPAVLRLPVAGDEFPVALERRCVECDGTGRRARLDVPVVYPCPGCDGHGLALTDAGRAVLDFVTRRTGG